MFIRILMIPIKLKRTQLFIATENMAYRYIPEEIVSARINICNTHKKIKKKITEQNQEQAFIMPL